MDLVILSTAPGCYSSRRLHAAATERGHNASVLNTLRFSIDLSESEPDLQFRGHPLDHVDAVIPRIGNSITYFGTAVVRQFDMMGVPVLNHAVAIARSRDKLRAMQLLTRKDLDIPITVCTKTSAHIAAAHPHVWITAKSEMVYAPDGSITIPDALRPYMGGLTRIGG